tara:strand:+ start:195 stop:1640 length:1446 start_codon:yes stop_codon:yes gene_type:complete
LKLLNLKLKKTNTYLRLLALGLLGFFALFLAFYNQNNCIGAIADTSNYCQNLNITITNTSSDQVDVPVRVPFVSSALVNQNYMDNFGSQILLTDNNLNDINFMNQNLTGTQAAGYWLVAPDLDTNVANVFKLFLGKNDNGNATQWRDNGFYFYKNDLVTIPYHVDFNLTDNIAINSDVYLSNLSSWNCPGGVPSIDTGYIFDRHENNTGYAVGVECEQQTLYNFVEIQGTKLRTPVTSGFNNRYNLKATYEHPDIKLFVDNSLVASATATSTMTSLIDNVKIGNNLNSTWVLNTELIKNINTTNNVVARYNFDITDLEETFSSSYAGTVADVSGNNHNGTYTMDRPQTYILDVGLPTTTGFQNFVINPQVDNQNQAILNADLINKSSANQFFPFFPFINTVATTSGLPTQFVFGGLFTFIAMLVGSVMIAATRQVTFGIFGFGTILYLGQIMNFYSLWFPLATLFIIIVLYGSSKLLSEGF